MMKTNSKTVTIKNLKPVTAKYSIAPPYLKLKLVNDGKMMKASFSCSTFSISTRAPRRKEAIRKLKQAITFVYLDIIGDEKVRKIFGNNADELLDIIMPIKDKKKILKKQLKAKKREKSLKIKKKEKK